MQAIAIHREVGGNLAEVLDRVSSTIRERGQLRRQAKALSAEGRISGIVLLTLPFVITAVLLLVIPATTSAGSSAPPAASPPSSSPASSWSSAPSGSDRP